MVSPLDEVATRKPLSRRGCIQLALASCSGAALPNIARSHRLPAEPAGPKLLFRGDCYFQLTTSLGLVVLFDPHQHAGYRARPQTADLVVVSHLDPDTDRRAAVHRPEAARWLHAVRPQPPGRGEANPFQVRIGQIQIQSWGISRRPVRNTHGRRDVQPDPRGDTAIIRVVVDDLVWLHLGAAGQALAAGIIQAIQPVDVVMLPVGGVDGWHGEAAWQVLQQLKPRWAVFPMRYGHPGEKRWQSAEEFLSYAGEPTWLEAGVPWVAPRQSEEPPRPDKPRIGLWRSILAEAPNSP